MTGQIDLSWPKPVKKGSKKGQKRVKIGHFGPLFDRSWLGPGSDLRQCSIKYSPFGQNRSEPAQKWSKKGSQNDPILAQKGVIFGTPFWTGPAQNMAGIGIKMAQNRSKMGQKWVKNGSKMGQKWVKNGSFWDTFFDRFWPFWYRFQPYSDPKPVKKWSKKWSKMGHFGPSPRPWIHGSYPDSLCKCSWNRGRGLKNRHFLNRFFPKKTPVLWQWAVKKSFLTFLGKSFNLVQNELAGHFGEKSASGIWRVQKGSAWMTAILAYFDHFGGHFWHGQKHGFSGWSVLKLSGATKSQKRDTLFVSFFGPFWPNCLGLAIFGLPRPKIPVFDPFFTVFDPFFDPFLTGLARTGQFDPSYKGYLRGSCQELKKGGQKGVQKVVIFSCFLTHFWTPFWQVLSRFWPGYGDLTRHTRDIWGVAVQELKKGGQKGVQKWPIF